MTVELDYLNEENGRLRREIATWKAETQALIKRAEDAEELAAGRLEQMNADRKQALVWRDEVERLKAQEPVAYVGEISEGADLILEKPTLWNAIPLYLASGAAQKEKP